MNNKIGIAFITCNRESLLQKSLDSLDTNITENVVIVNDGKKFENIQTKYPIIQHETNLSVCVTKNDAMKYLLEKNCDYIFLIEDDVKILNNEVFNKYIEASNVSNIQHLMFGYSGFANLENGKPKPKLVINYGRCKIALNHHCVGSFSMYTRKCLESVGLMDEKFNGNAFEHVSHSYEVIKHGMHPPFWYFADIFESDKCLEDMDRNFSSSSIRKSDKWIQNMQNAIRYFMEKHGKQPLEVEHVDASKVAEELKLIKKTIV